MRSSLVFLLSLLSIGPFWPYQLLQSLAKGSPTCHKQYTFRFQVEFGSFTDTWKWLKVLLDMLSCFSGFNCHFLFIFFHCCSGLFWLINWIFFYIYKDNRLVTTGSSWRLSGSIGNTIWPKFLELLVLHFHSTGLETLHSVQIKRAPSNPTSQPQLMSQSYIC